jgi:signal recognition particle subunit SRP54
MGDVLTLVEKAEAAIKEEDAEAMAKRLMSANFDFNDFLKQYKMVSGMGNMGQIMKMLPGARADSSGC